MPFKVLQWCDKLLWFISQNKRWCDIILGTRCCESFTTGAQTQAFFRSTQSFLNHLRLIGVIDCKKSFLHHLWQQLIAKNLSYTTCVLSWAIHRKHCLAGPMRWLATIGNNSIWWSQTLKTSVLMVELKSRIVTGKPWQYIENHEN